MAGAPQNMENGVPGGNIILDVLFYQYNGGPLVDDDGYVSSSTLPTVKIYNPNGTVVVDSTDQGETQAVRIAQGKYQYTYSIGAAAEISDTWKIEWGITIDGNALTFSEYFRVVAAGDAGFGEDEFRKGYFFNNPVYDSNHHAPGWGLLVTPDELRYIVHFGTKLVSPDASQTYDDNMLQAYIDNAFSMVQRDLNIDLFPTIVKHDDFIDPSTGARIPRDDIPQEDLDSGQTIVREIGYEYRPNNARHYLYIKLKRRPLRSVEKVVLIDPLLNSVVDLYPYRREYLGYESRLQFFPNFSQANGFPYFTAKFLYSNIPYHDFPDALKIDYKTGFLTADSVDREFRDVIRWTAGIMLMMDFGDGKAPGIASASANLNSISESFSTTQSATNALFGARIVYYQKLLKQWLVMNKNKYSRNIIGVI